MAAYDYINSSGLVVADTEDTKTEVENEQMAVFGDDVDLSDESPNGVLVNAEVITRDGIATNNANLANQINPNYAGGVFLDAIWALTRGLTGGRKTATRSTFSTDPVLTGVPGTLIPAGSIALAGEDQFESLSDLTLDSDGTGSVAFQSVESGPIPAEIGELNALAIGAVVGWETITNSVAATLGQSDEPDEISRQRRIDTLALQGISVAEAISSAISDLDGVKSLSYRENYTNSSATIDGILLLPNSVYACVDGGTDIDIATALLENKTVGANWNGDTTMNITDTTSGQSYPVKFDRPDEIPVWVRVTIAPTSVTNPASVIEETVLNYVDGLINSERGFVIGVNVSPFEIASAVNSVTPGLFIRKVEVSLNGLSYTTDELTIEIYEVARTDSAKIDTVIS